MRRVVLALEVLSGGCTERALEGEAASAATEVSTGPGGTDAGTSGATSVSGGGASVSGGGTSTSDAAGTSGNDTTTTSAETPGSEPRGPYLLALSTVLAPELPFQFYAVVTLESEGLSFMLFPLTLDQGRVTTPRTPFGGQYYFDRVSLADQSFELDLGEMLLVGATNPITGDDMLATLVLRGTFLADHFFCGTLDGQVLAPLRVPLTGSTFAALDIWLEDYPELVPLDCAGGVATDP